MILFIIDIKDIPVDTFFGNSFQIFCFVWAGKLFEVCLTEIAVNISHCYMQVQLDSTSPTTVRLLITNVIQGLIGQILPLAKGFSEWLFICT